MDPVLKAIDDLTALAGDAARSIVSCDDVVNAALDIRLAYMGTKAPNDTPPFDQDAIDLDGETVEWDEILPEATEVPS